MNKIIELALWLGIGIVGLLFSRSIWWGWDVVKYQGIIMPMILVSPVLMLIGFLLFTLRIIEIVNKESPK